MPPTYYNNNPPTPQEIIEALQREQQRAMDRTAENIWTTGVTDPQMMNVNQITHPENLARQLELALLQRFGGIGGNHGVVYDTYALPNVRALRVIIRRPEMLAGYEFTYNGQPLPEGLRIPPVTFNLQPPPPDFRFTTANPLNAPLNTIYNDIIRTQGWYTMPTVTATNAANATPVVIRTTEQEDRFQFLEMVASERALTPTEQEEYRVLGRIYPYIHPATERIRIKVIVRRNGQGYSARTNWVVVIRMLKPGMSWEVINNPEFKHVKGLLTPEIKRFFPMARDRFYLQEALEAGCNAQVLADILKTWAVAKYSQSQEGGADTNIDEETSYLLRSQPATLDVGGRIYRLVPTGEVDTRPLIRKVKTRALAGVKVEADGIRSRAATDARMVVTEAEQRAGRVRAEIEALQRSANSQVPVWIRDSKRPHFWDGSYWNLELSLGCKIREIRYTVSQWGDGGTVLYWNPLVPVVNGVHREDSWYSYHPMKAWVRLGVNGGFSLDSVRMKEWTVTHIHDRVCMGLQGVPSRLTNLEEVRLLEGILTRGMQVVNLNSPLSRERYWPDFDAQLPPQVKLFFANVRMFDSYRNVTSFRRDYPEFTWDREEAISREAETSFTLDDPRLVPQVGARDLRVEEALVRDTNLALADGGRNA